MLNKITDNLSESKGAERTENNGYKVRRIKNSS